MFLRCLLSPAIMLSISVAPRVAHADTLTQIFSTGPTSSEGSQDFYFDVVRFDPALGSLTSVGGSLSGSFTVYNPAQYGFVWHTLGFNPGEPLVYGRNYVNTITGSYTIYDSNIISDPVTLADVTGTGFASPQLYLNLNPEFYIASGGLTVIVSYNYVPTVQSLAVSPEPSGWVLLGTGIVSIAGLARGRFKRSALQERLLS